MTSSDVGVWRGALDDVVSRMASRFRRREVRERVTSYLAALLDRVGRKNGWQLAEHLGELGPRNVQRVLVGSRWDSDAVRDDLRRYVIEHLGAADGVLIVDETGFLKKGTKSAGVQRQYSGTAGRTENCQLGVFLVYGRARGRAFLDRELYLPESWIADQARCQEAGIPEGTTFATKPALAQRMLDRALTADVPAAWVVADEVYGNDEPLRRWLEARRQAFVLVVSSTHLLWQDMVQRPAATIVAELASDAWTTVSAGWGSKGERLYDWASIDLPYHTPDGLQHRLLVRRSRTASPELAYFRVLCPLQTSLEEVVRIAGMRWMIEECFEDAKASVGLDQYEVRRYDAWYRFITLALVAHAALEVTRIHTTTQDSEMAEKGGQPSA